METFVAKTRKVGNSLGLLIPGETVERERISVGQEVRVNLSSKPGRNIFGRFKDLYTQEELDEFVKENKDAWGD